jgi:diguanylate cyclase (GGDEF)-like protein
MNIKDNIYSVNSVKMKNNQVTDRPCTGLAGLESTGAPLNPKGILMQPQMASLLSPQQLYGILRNLLVQTAGLTGSAYLNAACQVFAREFDAQFVFITRTVDDPPVTVRMLAACKDGVATEGWEFILPGTPCEAIYQQPAQDIERPGPHLGATLIARDVMNRFEPTRNTGYESFIGMPLWSGEQRMIGHVALFFNRRLDDLAQQEQLVELVRLYSLKVEAELNRILIDESRQTLLQQLQQANERLALESVTDTLTGLYNRRHFNDRMRRVFALGQRQLAQYGLLLLDLDFFKAINDRHGHLAGDAVLRTVAETLLRCTRRDIEEVFRIGGEEFAIICSGVRSADDLAVAAGRLVQAVRAVVIDHGGQRLPVTASVGGAFPEATDMQWDDCYRRADERLYVAKAAGRDRAVLEDLPADVAQEVHAG